MVWADARRLARAISRHSRDDRVGALQAGAVGELGVDHEVALVLLRDESGRDGLETRDGQDDAARRRPPA